MDTFTGRVYDVDFVTTLGWCQVLMEGFPGGSLVAKTTDRSLQCALLAALSTRSERTLVHYQETAGSKWLTALRIVSEPESNGPRDNTIVSLAFGMTLPVWQVDLRQANEKVTALVLDERLLDIVANSIAFPNARFEWAVDEGVLSRAKINRG
jgi:hypothetical protein